MTSSSKLWQLRAGCALSDEDARKIAENIAGFFTVLIEWEAKEQEQKAVEKGEPYYAKSA